jgi:hypothetical protein
MGARLIVSLGQFRMVGSHCEMQNPVALPIAISSATWALSANNFWRSFVSSVIRFKPINRG